MWYYTLTITEDELKEVIDDLETRVNSFSRKYNPFRVVVEPEQLDPGMEVTVCRFSLAVTSDFEVPERKAVGFIETLKNAAVEVEKMNEQNYIIARPPSKRAGRP